VNDDVYDCVFSVQFKHFKQFSSLLVISLKKFEELRYAKWHTRLFTNRATKLNACAHHNIRDL